MHSKTNKPVRRSQLRFVLSQLYHITGRYFYWYFGGIKFARRQSGEFPFEIFSHRTPLLRKLKDVDMYLQYNKITNLKLASDKIDGITIRPGETFSFWKAVGRPSKRKGYLEGMILRSGTVSSGIGGGLCQLTNLIYWMVIHTPLTVIERHRHGYDVFPDSNRTQPFGSGASCFYNYMDLMIKNNTDSIYQLNINVGERNLEGRWLCSKPIDCVYDVYEKNHVMQTEYWGGYTRHNLIYRKKYNISGILLDDEYVIENHAVMMYSPLIPPSSEMDIIK